VHVRTPLGDDADDEWDIVDNSITRLMVDTLDDELSSDKEATIDLLLTDRWALSLKQAKRMVQTIERGNWITDAQR
jgi:hypothetical protein